LLLSNTDRPPSLTEPITELLARVERPPALGRDAAGVGAASTT
jgi:hypothetical protein